jgi:hypothetical protein
MTDYTTTEQIRNGFAAGAYTDAGVDRRLENFDRWLAARDAEVRVKVLRGAALSGLFGTNAQSTLLAMAEPPADTTGEP